MWSLGKIKVQFRKWGSICKGLEVRELVLSIDRVVGQQELKSYQMIPEGL